MNVLYVTPYVPSRIRTRPYNLILALVRLGHRVTLLTAAGSAPDELSEAEKLRDQHVLVEVFPVSPIGSLANCARALPTVEPLQAAYSYSAEMERRLAQLATQANGFDVVHIEHLRAARLVRAVRHIPVVYDSVDCISLLFEQTARRGAQWRSRLMAALDLPRTRAYEARVLTRFRHVLVTSNRDRDALQSLARRYLPADAAVAPITVVTNGVNLEYYRPRSAPTERDRRTIVFTGKMSYHANVAGALYFAGDVLPRIWARDPEARFQIVGKDPPEPLRRLAQDSRILVTGTVDDLRPYLAKATVAVCPVPYAVGVQFKVLEAMAMETPVVCTRAAFAGLESVDGEDVLVADDADEFAAHILRLCTDRNVAGSLAAAGRRYVQAHHSWDSGAQLLAQVYAQSGVRREGI